MTNRIYGGNPLLERVKRQLDKDGHKARRPKNIGRSPMATRKTGGAK